MKNSYIILFFSYWNVQLVLNSNPNTKLKNRLTEKKWRTDFV